MSSVSRQYVQKPANELIDEGLVEMEEDPAHKRSKLMRLTRAGELRFEALNVRFQAFLEEMAGEFPIGNLRSAKRTIAALRKRLQVSAPS